MKLNKAKRSDSIEDYLRVIYKLSEKEERVTTSSVAEKLSISSASVTKMLKRLSEEGLLEYEAYRGVSLTESGLKEAIALVRNHRLLELFLTEVLQVPWDRVDQEAHRLEHAVSEYLIEKIADLLGNPKRDPHGHPIPSKDGLFEEKRELFLLSQVEEGFSGVVVQVQDTQPELLRYIGEKGLFPNTVFRLQNKEPFGGNIHLQLSDSMVSISYGASQSIWVRKES